jgi:hypothetical protein
LRFDKKELRTKIKNKKSKDQSWNINKWDDNFESLNDSGKIQGEERRKKRRWKKRLLMTNHHLYRYMCCPK